jgi:hypothetical protein
MSSDSIALKVRKQTKAAPKLELPHGQPLSSAEVKKLRKFLATAATMQLNPREEASVSGIRQTMKTPRNISLSAEESASIDWIITRRHCELPPETIICSSAQINELWNFTECIGEGRLTPAAANFVNWIRQKVRMFRHDVVWLTPREAEHIEEIKLRFRQPGAWLRPIDQDGVEENDDPDGYPVEREDVDPFEQRLWESIDWNDRSEPALP